MLLAITIILHLNIELCSGQCDSYGAYPDSYEDCTYTTKKQSTPRPRRGFTCDICIVGRRRTQSLCRKCVSGKYKKCGKASLYRLHLIGSSGGPFTCRRCELGTEVSTYDCRGCTNNDPDFGKHSMDEYCSDISNETNNVRCNIN